MSVELEKESCFTDSSSAESETDEESDGTETFSLIYNDVSLAIDQLRSQLQVLQQADESELEAELGEAKVCADEAKKAYDIMKNTVREMGADSRARWLPQAKIQQETLKGLMSEYLSTKRQVAHSVVSADQRKTEQTASEEGEEPETPAVDPATSEKIDQYLDQLDRAMDEIANSIARKEIDDTTRNQVTTAQETYDKLKDLVRSIPPLKRTEYVAIAKAARDRLHKTLLELKEVHVVPDVVPSTPEKSQKASENGQRKPDKKRLERLHNDLAALLVKLRHEIDARNYYGANCISPEATRVYEELKDEIRQHGPDMKNVWLPEILSQKNDLQAFIRVCEEAEESEFRVAFSDADGAIDDVNDVPYPREATPKALQRTPEESQMTDDVLMESICISIDSQVDSSTTALDACEARGGVTQPDYDGLKSQVAALKETYEKAKNEVRAMQSEGRENWISVLKSLQKDLQEILVRHAELMRALTNSGESFLAVNEGDLEELQTEQLSEVSDHTPKHGKTNEDPAGLQVGQSETGLSAESGPPMVQNVSEKPYATEVFRHTEHASRCGGCCNQASLEDLPELEDGKTNEDPAGLQVGQSETGLSAESGPPMASLEDLPELEETSSRGQPKAHDHEQRTLSITDENVIAAETKLEATVYALEEDSEKATLHFTIGIYRSAMDGLRNSRGLLDEYKAFESFLVEEDMDIHKKKVVEFDGRIVAVMKSLVELEDMAEADNREESRALEAEHASSSAGSFTSTDAAPTIPRANNIGKKKKNKRKGCCVVS
eukprot:CAMPEP_0184752546 /NCGR_PEP_ID=MMETSP0315-20130426/43631_1 /TAXON_ID=101924 /ORGANISM="Rhodosorus marinus, Strain UTEX LB 2760" /LENGTH=779 /DNA_ID=CAMNT_0027231881 /DNA_START=610 /DNA_END=2949 /DNA_ORIENTATION=-